ncbi:hypothetical protein D3C87_1576420 [compost metagenome]
MGIGLDAARGIADADGIHQFHRTRQRRLLADRLVREDGLGDLFAHRKERVQRRQRVLEDIGDASAAQTDQLLLGQAQHFLAPHIDPASSDHAWR